MISFIGVFLYTQGLPIISTNANPLIGQAVKSTNWNTDNELSFVVSLGKAPANQPEDHICTGTLITKRHVLTARHCLEDHYTIGRPKMDIRNFKVTIGSHDVRKGQKYGIMSYESYFDWARENKIEPDATLFHDVAIATLDKDVEDVTPAKISELTHEDIYGKEAMVAGWGSTEYERRASFLRKASVDVLSKAQSEKNFEKTKAPPYRTKNHLCTPGSVCLGEGDCGGPLFISGDEGYEVIGVNSHRYPDTDVQKPARFHPNYQNCHQSVHFYRHFIESIIKRMSADGVDHGAGSSHTSPHSSPPESPWRSPSVSPWRSPSVSPWSSPPRSPPPKRKYCLMSWCRRYWHSIKSRMHLHN